MNATVSPGKRFDSIDCIRGAAMVLMAIDHTRVLDGECRFLEGATGS